MGLLGLILSAVLTVVIAYLVFKLVQSLNWKKVIANSIAGIITLFVLNLIGIKIPITLINLIIVAIGGFIGVLFLLLLYFLGGI